MMQAASFRSLFSAEHLVKAMRTLDRTAVVMISVTWVCALIIMGIALYTVNANRHAALQVEESAAIEPIVPTVHRALLPRAQLEQYAGRLRNQFSKVNFNAMSDNSLEVISADAGAFRDWMLALSYLDTIAPQVRWTVRELCVGNECGTGAVMRAYVIGEKATFRLPAVKTPAPDGKKKS